MLTVVERVLLLAEVDVFAEMWTEDLAHLASVAVEHDLARGEVVYTAGEPPDGIHLVVEGRVRLERPGGKAVEATAGMSFGTWAFFDAVPRLFTATAAERTRLLSIGREEFVDVLSDHVRISQGVLKVLAARVRRFVADDPRVVGTVQEIGLG